MFKILAKERLTPIITMFEIEAPAIARKAQPGMFVMVRVDETGERFPLSLSDWDSEAGTITLIVMDIGTSTRKLSCLELGESILNIAGPLGLPAHIENFGTVVCMGGCYGIGAIYRLIQALKTAGNRVISIVEGRNKNLIYWEERLALFSDELIVTTGDGTLGCHGWAYDPLKDMLAKGAKINQVFSHGCNYMMMLCSETTKPFNIRTMVSLNPIMVDGTGMCGVCRVSIGGVTKFACVDGPEFDGHQVDWELLASRRLSYIEEETRSLEYWESQRWCNPMILSTEAKVGR